MGTPVNTNVVIASDNGVVADSMICRFFGMDPLGIGHLKLAERENLGTTNESSVETNGPTGMGIRLRPRRAFMDHFALLTFKSRMINKTVMDSPISPLLYRLLRPFRTNKERSFYESDLGELPKSQFRRDEGP